jgi:chromosome segregation ATPase
MAFELALQEIERQVKVYKAFEEAQNALMALASLEQNTKELEAVKKVLDLSLAKLKEEIKKKENKLTLLEAQLNAKEVYVKDTIKEYEAQKLFDLNYKFSNLTKEKEKEISSLDDIIAGLNIKITGHDTYLKAKQLEIETIEAKISAAKAQMQRMLNGSV